MKKIGIVGGLGPESTIDYYRKIYRLYRERTDGQYPEMIIYSLNFKDFPCTGSNAGLDRVAVWLIQAIQNLYKAGAECAVIAANTPHIVYDEVTSNSPIPVISIVEETCRVAHAMDLKRVGLLGTITTMNASYYQQVFAMHNIGIIVPRDAEKEYIHDKLEKEIMQNTIVDQTRRDFLLIIKRMIDEDGIDGLILGCTEIPLLLQHDEYGIPFLNTSQIHAEAVVSFSIS